MNNPMGQRKMIGGTILWFVLALIAGASGLTLNLVPPFPQIVLFGLFLFLLLLFWFSRGFRRSILNADIRALVGVHVTRFVGFYFLYLYSLNLLPYDFAVIGGWGDIIVALGALFLVLFVPPIGKVGVLTYSLWNLIGLIDILFVVVTATRLATSDPQSMSELLKLPLSLLPTFLVPIIIFTHIVIFIKLYNIQRRA